MKWSILSRLTAHFGTCLDITHGENGSWGGLRIQQGWRSRDDG
jgi:hypothetical protein